jgi:ATP-dependent Clp protease ATP-binding subunit ClpA
MPDVVFTAWLQQAWNPGDPTNLQPGAMMFERFTDRARRVLVLAQEEARLLNHNFIGTEHILLGLIHEGAGVASKALATFDVDLDQVRACVTTRIGEVDPAGGGGSPPFTPRARKVLELSLREALQLGHNFIGTEHILLGLIRDGEGVAATVLVADLHLNLSKIRQAVIQLLSGYAAVQAKEATLNRLLFLDQPFTQAEITSLAEYGGVTESQVLMIAWVTALKLAGTAGTKDNATDA